jgi:hypothetical protein
MLNNHCHRVTAQLKLINIIIITIIIIIRMFQILENFKATKRICDMSESADGHVRWSWSYSVLVLRFYLWRTDRAEAESTHSWTSEDNTIVYTVEGRRMEVLLLEVTEIYLVLLTDFWPHTLQTGRKALNISTYTYTVKFFRVIATDIQSIVIDIS